MKCEYSEAVDPVIYEGPTAEFDSDDWISLAMAALDQAGVSARVQDRILDIAKQNLTRTVAS